MKKEFDYRTIAMPILVLIFTYYISNLFVDVKNYDMFVAGYILCFISYKLYNKQI